MGEREKERVSEKRMKNRRLNYVRVCVQMNCIRKGLAGNGTKHAQSNPIEIQF